MTRPPDPPSRWCRCRTVACRAARIGVILAAPLLAAAGWVVVFGLPDAATRRLLEGLEQRGLIAEVERIRYDLLEGFVFDQVRLHAATDPNRPVAEAERVSVRLTSRRWHQHGLRFRRARLHGATLRLGGAAAARPWLEMEDMSVTLKARPDHLLVEEGRVRVLGLHATLDGELRYPDGPDPDAVQDGATIRGFADVLDRLAAEKPPWAHTLTEVLESAGHARPPRALLRFRIPMGRPMEAEVQGIVDGGGLAWRDVILDGWSAEALVFGERIRLRRLEAVRDGARVSLSGTGDLTARTFELSAENTFSPDIWIPMLPAAWRHTLTDHRTRFDGPILGTIHVGPNPIDQPLDRVTADFRIERAVLRGVPVQSARLGITRAGARTDLSVRDAWVGPPGRTGRLEGDLGYREDTGEYDGWARSRFDLAHLLTALPPERRQTLGRFVFSTPYPQVDAAWAGQGTDARAFTLDAVIQGRNLSYRNQEASAFLGRVQVSGGRILISDARMIRADGEAAGWFLIDPVAGLAAVDVESSIPPEVMARIVAPDVLDTLSFLDVTGPSTAVVSGWFDLRGGGRNRYDAAGESGDLTLWGFPGAAAHVSLRGTGPRLEIPVFDGILSGGRATGGAHIVTQRSLAPCDAHTVWIRSHRARLAPLIRAARDPEASGRVPLGRLDGDLVLVIPEARHLEGWMGGGEVRVRDGNLGHIPLIGGLSRALGSVVSELDVAAYTDLRGTFDIDQGRIHSSDLRLESTLSSIAGRGSVGLDGTLDMRVQARVFRLNPLTAIVRLVTYPISRLFEYQLDGTLQDPEWSAVNLP